MKTTEITSLQGSTHHRGAGSAKRQYQVKVLLLTTANSSASPPLTPPCFSRKER